MPAMDTVSGLAGFTRRGAGSDSERRAALWLRDELRARGRDALIEPFWSRPNSALAHAWHAGIGLAGSLVSVGSPRVGGLLILVALLSIVADALLGVSPGRRLTPEHASQNVVSPAPDSARPKRVRLILTANYDAGRTGVAYRELPRRISARLRRLTGALTPGWLGWMVIALIWLEAVAIIRLGGTGGTGPGVAQFLPTVGLVLALATLLDVASADFSPAAGDNATGVAAAVALARALDAAAPRHAHVEIVLQGASDGTSAGLRAYLKARRGTIDRTNVVVIGLSPLGAGRLRWWESDGPLVPLRYFRGLRALIRELAEREPELELRAHHGRGSSPALPARIRRLPALTLGALDERGIAPRSHQAADTADAVDAAVLARAVEAGLLLVDGIDASLAQRPVAPD